MACIRMELAVKLLPDSNIYDCLAEDDGDFTADTFLKDIAGVGSMAYCMEDGKVYIKTATGWEAQE